MHKARQRLAALMLLALWCWGAAAAAASTATSTAAVAEVVELESLLVTAEAEEELAQRAVGAELLRQEQVIDLAELLSQQSASTALIRKSGYGNEVSVRGFGKADLGVLYDDAMLEGACGSRKDPALSHVPLLAVKQVRVQPGPFDVARHGGLGGVVAVETAEPQTEETAELWLKGGSFDYRAAALQLTGGTERFQALMGYAATRMDPYRDGGGRRLTDYAPAGRPYSAAGRKQAAFDKQDVWTKLRWQLTPDQSLTLAHTYGLAEDVLTPRVAVDIEKERTALTQLRYEGEHLARYSDRLQLRLYHHDVQHEPSDRYRELVGAGLPGFHRRFEARSTLRGAHLANTLDTPWAQLTFGVSHDHQNWNANAFNAASGARINNAFIPGVRSNLWGGYVQGRRHLGALTLQGGLRYDEARMAATQALPFSQRLTAGNQQRDRYGSGYLLATWYPGEDSSLFVGLGQGARLPTGAERYLQGSASFFGNPALKPTRNREIDIGGSHQFGALRGQVKLFYADLTDFIYQQAQPFKTWGNIDAHLYGAETRFDLPLGPFWQLQASAAWQRGRKDEQPPGNADRDLSEVPPWKTRLALDYARRALALEVEWLHAGASRQVDEAAGEVRMADWDVVNLSARYELARHWTLHLGVENLFDAYYAVANSYEYDVVSGAAVAPPIIYEPGRMAYLSLVSRW
ncbi:TonB-dependent receptor [Desulfuromonas thiophila]|uniref:TonB-dependent receptor n=1 Tax=Desulfuromonas thiophila TaxID=57664 RepID=UPI0029F5744E|nr:TonB-dependent receptor [Desulfuromonas thiophila]